VFRRLSDLAAVMAAASACLLVTLLAVDSVVLRTIFALPLVFVLPGYALVRAVFTRREIGITERLLFSVGLSLALTILGGVLLNLTPWGLQPVSWAVWLWSLTAAACLAALLLRRPALAVDAASHRWLGVGQRIPQLITAAVLLGAAVVMVRLPTPFYGFEGYTSLSMVPVDGQNRGAVRVEIDSAEFQPAAYRLAIDINGRVVQEWTKIELEPGEQWNNIVSLPTPPTDEETVNAVLYRVDTGGAVYRSVALRSNQD